MSSTSGDNGDLSREISSRHDVNVHQDSGARIAAGASNVRGTGASWAWFILAALALHALVGALLIIADQTPDESPRAKEIPVEVVTAVPETASSSKAPPSSRPEKNEPQSAAENSPKAEPSAQPPKRESKREPERKPSLEQFRAEKKAIASQRARDEPPAATGAKPARNAEAGSAADQPAANLAPAGDSRAIPALPFDLGPPIFHAVAVPMPVDGDGELVNYKVIVFGMLERVKHFPEAAAARGAQGASVVAFALDEQGGVKSVALLRSSGDADLDAESVAVVTRASPFPAPPPGAQRNFAAEITFGRPPPDH